MERFMVFGIILLGINLEKFSVTAYAECTKTSTLKTLGLRNKLLCDYDYLARPSETKTTMVALLLIPKFIEFDDSLGTLTVHTWLSVSWEDPHLSWKDDPQYSSISRIHVSSDEIWKPDISVYNSGEIGYEQSGMPSTNCLLSKDNHVTCLPAVKYVTRCTPDYQHWPFDRQSCTVRLGSWIHNKNEIDYILRDTGVEMLDFTENLEWKVLSMNVTKKMVMFEGFGSEHPSVLVDVVLERHSTLRHATVIAPAILLIIMTLTVLWLNPMSVERMVMAGINLVCHLLCMMELNWQVPFNGHSLPSIMVFHQNSLIIASVAFFLTALLRQLREISLPAPVWLTSMTSLILESRAGQFILLTTLDPKASAILENVEEDNAGLVQSNSSASKSSPGITAWHHFATLIDRVSFVCIFFTYAIMVLVLIPRNDIKE